IGCGGTICRHTSRGDRVVAVFLTSGELGLKRLPREQAWAVRETEARRAARILRIAQTEFCACRIGRWATTSRRAPGCVWQAYHHLENDLDPVGRMPSSGGASAPVGRVPLPGGVSAPVATAEAPGK